MDSHFDFVSVVRPNIVGLKILGFWRSLKPNSVFNTIWYNSYTATVMSLQFFFEGTGFMFLYDKWENLSLFDINSVIFIYSTALLNLLMMILIHSKIKVSGGIKFELYNLADSLSMIKFPKPEETLK
nr:unnamed protein product [Callosobruchus chinensis]